VDRLEDIYKESNAVTNPKLKSLIEEFFDYLGTEYFESAVFDLIDNSYQRNLKQFIS
jgi:hypothetical protein